MNPLLCTDVYKMGHMEQYPEGTNKIYSYLMARSDKKYGSLLFYGLQYYLCQYMQHRLTVEDVDEFLALRYSILGMSLSQELEDRLYRLVDMGYFPLEIKAIPEGTRIGTNQVLMTVTNTDPDYAFLVGFFESLLLKVWNTCTVATASAEYKKIALRYAQLTCDDEGHLPFAVHDFGYRGASSEETAALSGSAHLLNFMGTDTVPAVALAKKYYLGKDPVGLSVPATEHCVMCVHGKLNEYKAFERMLDVYPESAIISIVSDTYNLWNVLTNFAPRLKEKILARSGKVVFRPDSGNPVDIICGTRYMNHETPEQVGALRLLEKVFGSTLNAKGYKVLNPKVGLIYGDGMYLQRYEEMLSRMEDLGFASSNLVIGVGGLLLQQHSRDDLGFAFKATYCEVDGKPRQIFKDPITDKGKRSHKGLLRLDRKKGNFKTYQKQTPEQEREGILRRVFSDGRLYNVTNLDLVRAHVQWGEKHPLQD